MQFPIGGPLEPGLYLQLFSRYSAQTHVNEHANEHTNKSNNNWNWKLSLIRQEVARSSCRNQLRSINGLTLSVGIDAVSTQYIPGN